MSERHHRVGTKPHRTFQGLSSLPDIPSPVKIKDHLTTEETTKVLGVYTDCVEIIKKEPKDIFGAEHQPESALCQQSKDNVFDKEYKQAIRPREGGTGKKSRDSRTRDHGHQPSRGQSVPSSAATMAPHKVRPYMSEYSRRSPNVGSQGRSSQTPPTNVPGKPSSNLGADGKSHLAATKPHKERLTKSNPPREHGMESFKSEKNKKHSFAPPHDGSFSTHSSRHTPSPTPTAACDDPHLIDRMFLGNKSRQSSEKRIKEKRSHRESHPLVSASGHRQDSRKIPTLGKIPSQNENGGKDSLPKSMKSKPLVTSGQAPCNGGTVPSNVGTSSSSKPSKKRSKKDKQLDLPTGLLAEVAPSKRNLSSTVSSGSVPSGSVPSGSVSSGSVSSGSVSSGSVPSGSVPSGSVSSGSVPSGGVPRSVPSGGVPRHSYIGNKSPKLPTSPGGVHELHCSSREVSESKSRPNNLTLSNKPAAVYEAISQDSSSGVCTIIQEITQGMVTPISGITTPQKKSSFAFPLYSNIDSSSSDAPRLPSFTPISEEEETCVNRDDKMTTVHSPTFSVSHLNNELDVSSSSSEDEDEEGEDSEVESGTVRHTTAQEGMSPTLKRVQSIIGNPLNLLTPIKPAQKPFLFPNQEHQQTMNTIKEEPAVNIVKTEPMFDHTFDPVSIKPEEGHTEDDVGTDTNSSSDNSSSSNESDSDSDSDSDSSEDELELEVKMESKDSVNPMVDIQPLPTWPAQSMLPTKKEPTEDQSSLNIVTRLPKKRPQSRNALMAKMASVPTSNSISVTSSGIVNVAMPTITTSSALSTGSLTNAGLVLVKQGNSPHVGDPAIDPTPYTVEGVSDSESSGSDSRSESNDVTLTEKPLSTPTGPTPPSTGPTSQLTKPSSPPPKQLSPPPRPLSPPTGPLIVSILRSKIKPQNMAIVEPIVVSRPPDRKRPSRSTSQDDDGHHMRYSHRSNYDGHNDDYSRYNYSHHRRRHRSRSPQWHNRSSGDWRSWENSRRYPHWQPRTADEHLKEARALKHYGDQASSENKKVDFYFNSVLHFMMWAHESELANRNCAFMYNETAKLIDFILNRNGLNMLARENHIAVLCLRCQANLYFKYFEVKVKQEASIQYQKTLREFFPKASQSSCSISPYASSSPGAPSPASMSSGSSTQGTPGRADGICTLPPNMVTMAINHLDLFEHFYKSNECWQLSNEIIARNRENMKFFANLDKSRGPISQYGPANVVVDWAREGLSWII